MRIGVCFLVLYAVTIRAEGACDPADPNFVCGLHNPEDLLRLPGTPWVVASDRNFVHEAPFYDYDFGPLRVVHIETRKVRQLYPAPDSAIDWDRHTYPRCSKPPENISSHGLNVKPLESGKFRLYVNNHGDRDSVEIIDVTVHGEQLRPTWRGCVRSSALVWPNGIAPLPDGGLVMSGWQAGVWRPGQGWKLLDFRFDGVANGVETSPDGRWAFVSNTEKRQVIRIPVDGGVEPTVIQFKFWTDNLRWGDDGYLYVGGPDYPPDPELQKCYLEPVCDLGSTVVAQIDPNSLTAREVLRTDPIKGKFGVSTTAVLIGDRFWIGTSQGDRIAIIAPNKPVSSSSSGVD
jgi:hypothetical protein